MAGSQKRRQYVVYRHVQFYYLAIWVLGVITALLVAGLLYYFTRVYPQGRGGWTEARYLYVALIATVFVIIGMAMAMGLHAILTSHKIAGAAYRIHEGLKRVRQRDYEHVIQLREGDYLQELADGINELTGDLKRIRGLRDEVLGDLAELKKAAAEGRLDTGKATQLAGEMEKKLDRV